MNKALINKICGKFGFEINGTSYMQQLRRNAESKDVFIIQKDLLNGRVNTIFDLGANYGSVTEIYKNVFPDAAIYAFEPFPEVFKSLTEKVGQLRNVKVYDKAVTDSSGKRTFFVNENADTNSLYKSQETGLSSDKQAENKYSIEVDAVSLNDFCREEKIQKIDILKMDIQGGELGALKGATNLLEKKQISLLYLEAFFIPQYQDQPLFQDLLSFLFAMGYQLQDIYNPFYGKGSLAWCDAIFLPKR